VIKKKQMKMTMMKMGDGNAESDGDEEEDGDDGDEIVDVDRMDGGSSADGRGGKPGAVTYRERGCITSKRRSRCCLSRRSS
jgi:hypothetical protein